MYIIYIRITNISYLRNLYVYHIHVYEKAHGIIPNGYRFRVSPVQRPLFICLGQWKKKIIHTYIYVYVCIHERMNSKKNK